MNDDEELKKRKDLRDHQFWGMIQNSDIPKETQILMQVAARLSMWP